MIREKGQVAPRRLLAPVDSALSDEWVEILARRPGLRIERIVSLGHSSPDGFWYDQDEDEWILVVDGAARLELEGQQGVIELGPGDFLEIPARTRHRVAWTDPGRPTVWLAVFLAPLPGARDGSER